jgi:hypothetical protein
MGKLEPSILVIPIPIRTGLVPKGQPIEVEYFQEDFVGEVVDRHSSGRRPVTIAGANASFSGKSLSQLIERTVVLCHSH